ncbi:MAG: glycosyltransferase [Lachnospiraceae bacterium]|jgi:glycosyltransferase involved in cell wall biosynthesis
MSLLSVVLPSFNEDEILPETARILRRVLTQAEIPYELIFVDDGSGDRTWEEITQLHEEDPHVHGLHFSRNFGKEAAICAGLAAAKGNCAAVMDCDLQHPPETLVEMYRKWQEGFEVVEGVKRSRGTESSAHKWSVGIFYRIMSKVTKTDMSHASDFKLLDRKAVDVLLEMSEQDPFFRAQSSWIGFKTAQVEFDVQKRAAGQSKWNMPALIRYALSNIAGYSSMPMQIVTVIGFLFLLISAVTAIVFLCRLIIGAPVTALAGAVLLMMLIGSILMIALGIVGYYLSRIYREVQGRPKYIISRKI